MDLSSAGLAGVYSLLAVLLLTCVASVVWLVVAAARASRQRWLQMLGIVLVVGVALGVGSMWVAPVQDDRGETCTMETLSSALASVQEPGDAQCQTTARARVAAGLGLELATVPLLLVTTRRLTSSRRAPTSTAERD
ncbi:hypothetical protein GCM10027596_40290 [Nocardioides korecus]